MRRALASWLAQPRACLTPSLPPPFGTTTAAAALPPPRRAERPLSPLRVHMQRERETRKLTAVLQESRVRERWRKTAALDFWAACRRRRGNWSAEYLDKILESERGIYIKTICIGGCLSQPPVYRWLSMYWRLAKTAASTNALVLAVYSEGRMYKCIFSLFKVFLIYIFRNYLNDSKNHIFENICPKLVKIFLLCSS